MSMLLVEINNTIKEKEQFCALLERFNADLADPSKQLTMESVHSVLDRIQFALQKRFIPDDEKLSIAKTLAALALAKKNLQGKKGPELKELLDDAGINDVVKGVEKIAPGAINSVGDYIKTLMQDITDGGPKVNQVIKDLRTLGPTFDQATGRENISKQTSGTRQAVQSNVKPA